MNKILTSPPFLKQGDKVAIIGMASKFELNEIQQAIHILQHNWQLEVILGESAGASYYSFSGSDALRQADFQKMLDDESIKAIFSARGGYGSAKFIDTINWRGFKKKPKWVIGFSDITAVLSKIYNLGIESVHGPMPKTFTKDAFSTQSLKNILFGLETKYYIEQSNQYNRLGKAQGQIIGGNLCLFANQIGTKSDINTSGKILFLEDVGEYYYSLDRMFVQLKRAGKLKDLAGLVLGQFSDSKEEANQPFGKDIYEIISEHTSGYSYPVAFDFPFGHELKNYPIIIGRNGTFFVENSATEITF